MSKKSLFLQKNKRLYHRHETASINNRPFLQKFFAYFATLRENCLSELGSETHLIILLQIGFICDFCFWQHK